MKKFNKHALMVQVSKAGMNDLKEFAKLQKVNANYMYQKVNRFSTVTVKDIEKWAELLGCEPTDFFA